MASATREGRRIEVALRTAKLMPIKTLESFDFTFQPSLDRERIAALAQLDFVRRAEVVHFLGPPGTGKSHLATALGVAAVKAGRTVYRATLAELIEALSQAERSGRLPEKIRFYSRAALLIVDEIGYLPITRGGANLFFQLVNARYEKGAMILTSNRGFAEWGEVFGDPVVATALLDRLLHHAVVIQIEGASYRLRAHADLIPEHVRRRTVAAINARGGDWCLALKANQDSLLSDARACFGKVKEIHPVARQEEAGHGRQETRTAMVVSAKGLAEHHEFPGLKGFGRIEASREADGRTTSETRFFALSWLPTPEVLMATVRAHWAIENALHWQLDVSFREDAARNRKDNGPANIAVLRRRAMDVARRDTSKGSLSMKLQRAGWDDAFLRSILYGLAAA